jgi:ribosomal protein L37AE/L43A
MKTLYEGNQEDRVCPKCGSKEHVIGYTKNWFYCSKCKKDWRESEWDTGNSSTRDANIRIAEEEVRFKGRGTLLIDFTYIGSEPEQKAIFQTEINLAERYVK